MIALVALLAQIAAAQVTQSVTGTATYRERMALPPNAVFEATLEDVSRADAAATIVNRFRNEKPGLPPFRFSITYDPAKIAANRSYVVRAKVTAGENLLFTTDQSYPVLTQGKGDRVSIVMRRAGSPPASPLGALPATFTGELPCADCPGIRYTLNLFPDGAFYRRAIYRERNNGRPTDEIGRWVLAPGNNKIQLHAGGQVVDRLAVKSRDTLRKLDAEGNEIQSKLNYDFRRTAAFQPFEVRLPMNGMFRYMADAAAFTECQTGQRFAVAMEADYRALESAYSRLRRQPGEELAASFEGRLTPRLNPDTRQNVATVVVERFGGVWPGESCGAPLATSPMRETYWKLTRLEDSPVVVAEGQREPHLVFRAEGDRVTGHAGCNNLTGSYRADQSGITISRVATTRMACLQGMDLEGRFLRALDGIRSWRIVGEHLELYGASGSMIARFEARALR